MEKSIHSTFPVREVLRNIGFTENEIKVITYLFYSKRADAKEVSKEAFISFAAAQYNLENLANKGLLLCHKEAKEAEDLYEIIEEKDFLRWIDDQKKKHDEIYDVAKKTLGSFWTEIEGSEWKPAIRYYEGREGIVEIYEDMLTTSRKTDKKIRSWLDIEKIKEVLGDYLYQYIEKRREFGIVSYDIVPKNETNLLHHKKKEDREIRFINNLPIQGELRIYGDKVAVISFHEKNSVGFVFQGEIYASLFRAIFECQWKNAEEGIN